MRVQKSLMAVLAAVAAIGFGSVSAASAAFSGSYEGDEQVLPQISSPDQFPDEMYGSGPFGRGPSFGPSAGPPCGAVRAAPRRYTDDEIAACGLRAPSYLSAPAYHRDRNSERS